MDSDLTVRTLRSEMGLTLADFAVRVGLSSAGYLSTIEAGGPCSIKVALAIETLSDGRIDAGGLNDDVRAARAGHARLDTADPEASSAGIGAASSRPEVAA